MEQLIYFLEHTTNTSDQVLGVFNFVLAFIIVPLCVVVLPFFILRRVAKRKRKEIEESEKNRKTK